MFEGIMTFMKVTIPQAVAVQQFGLKKWNKQRAIFSLCNKKMNFSPF